MSEELIRMSSEEKARLLKKWMFCLNTVDICLNSKYAYIIPDELYILLNDTRLELEELLAYYEHESHETTKGRA